ncbi:metal-dependent transcriptional regulator [Halobellus rarus]|uniref:Metal-dependent transcriptional regulator n=1 Tax=Halobellus rarus TaxID=1126237 RepID=A0ABD6CMX9_9EURY|nr:metal-dependent transcriptional regulator [Halobellus rarus]
MAATKSTVTRCECSHPGDCVSRRAGRYLTVVYRLLSDGPDRVGTGEVSARLDVSPASATEMFDRLATDALVDYEKHDGVRLTHRGTEVARELAWRQCAVRAFFATELDLEFDAETSYRFGYVLPASGVETLCELTDHGPVDCAGVGPSSPRKCLYGASAN